MHLYDEEWYWAVPDQDYRILLIHQPAQICPGCKLGVPIED